jgi:hypothetical protein
MGENIGRKFSLLNVSSCFSTTKGAMTERRPQAYSAPWIGLETSLVAFLILGWWCFIDGWNIGRKFSPLNVSACFSTTTRAMNKWIAQSHSAHQIGPGPTPYRVLIVGWWCCARWFKFRSGKSFFNVCGSFTWLHYNQTNILENQTLLLARNSFYTGHPGGLLVRLFKEFLARPVLWLSEKLWELLLCNLLTREFA